MLTIQPNFTRPMSKSIVFKANTEESLRKDREFLEEQERDFTRIIEDDKAPGFLRKFAKIAKVGIIGIIEATIVTCAGIKSAKFLKSGAAKFAESSIGKGLKSVASPVKSGLKTSLDLIREYGSKLYNKVKANKYAQKLFGPVEKFLKENPTGQKVAKVYDMSKAKIEKISNKIAEKLTKVTYDGVTEKVSYAAGVGAGVGAVYNSSREDRQENVSDYDDNSDYYDEMEED